NITLQDGTSHEAVLVGFDPDTDLALLRIHAHDLPTIAFGDSKELRVGQVALAIGNPFDVGQTVTAGIISALGRHGLGLNSYEDFIQTDAAINQGNSGGALINTKGELIGINTAIFSPQSTEGFVGIGFAIPTAIIQRILPRMKAGQNIEKGYFGFVPKQLSKEFAQDIGLSRYTGVMVDRIVPHSPASRSKLLPFD
ncbi:HtrA2 peptidase, partial [gut metagenome]